MKFLNVKQVLPEKGKITFRSLNPDQISEYGPVEENAKFRFEGCKSIIIMERGFEYQVADTAEEIRDGLSAISN